MRDFLEVFGFELRLQIRSPMFAGMLALFFAMHVLTMSQTGVHISDNQLIDYNSAYLIFRTELVLTLVGLLPAVVFVVTAATRDEALGAADFFYTTPVPKPAYLFGRFAGGATCALIVGLVGVLGAVAGTLVPSLDPQRLAPFDWRPYALVFATLTVPNLLVFGAFSFAAAVLGRSALVSFAMVLGFVVLGLILNNPAVANGPAWVSMLDPFGGVAVERLTRYWTVAQLNEIAPTALLAPNRLLWLALGGLALAFTGWRFRLQHQGPRASWLKLPWAPRPATAPRAASASWRPRFGGAATLAQFGSQWRMDLRSVLISPLFWLVVALTVVSTISEISGKVSALMDLPLHPLTSQMLGFVRYGMLQFVLIVIVFYSGVLIHRERDHRLNEILGAAPYPDWLPLVSKTLSLCAVLMLLLAATVLTSIAWQLLHGQRQLDLPVYVQDVFVFSGFYFCMLAVLACLLQTFAPGKWSGMMLTVAVIAVLLALEPAGFEHLLYGFRIPFVVYTDMNGFGQFLTPTYSLIVYWGAFCILLLVAGHLLMARGVDPGWRGRLRGARARFTAPVRRVSLAATAVFVIAGGWIFYNTNILNPYETARTRLEAKADYERRYGAFRQAPSPAMTSLALNVDLYPRQRSLRTSGRAVLRNTTAAPLSEVFVSVDPRIVVQALAVEGATLSFQDRRQGVFRFALAHPLQPGAETAVTWRASRSNPGFVNSGSDTEIVRNGTFVSLLTVMPGIGYDGERELTSPTDRKRMGLPPAARLPALGDQAWLGKIGFGAASRMDFSVVFSTDPDQIAVAPGTLRREWTQGGRRYFDYRLDVPTPPAISLASARYQVARRESHGVTIEVYYDRHHPWNIDTMLDTSAAGLDYFSREFAPYPLSYFRIVEFPGYRSQAQAHVGTINYSEDVGFTNDLSGWAPLDYTTIHELAHQWWGGMAYGARMQGRQILNEGLAQYSTFMLFKQQPDQRWVRRILAKANRDFLAARSEEGVGEQPVIRTEDQGYISYNKAPLALYWLQELIGPQKVNQALRAYLQKFALQPPPFPTSLDLVAELRAVAGPQYQSLITDLFEKIMLYDVQMSAVSVRPVGSEYEVTMDITARQFQADGRGRQTEVPLDTWFDVVVFPNSKQPLIAQTPLYHAHQKLHSGRQRLTVRVAQKPGAAGVDPYHLMIDPNPDDNVRQIKWATAR
jgi:ABC-type transport system involved in multi-copper enzyme maturation permease subunit